MRRKRNSGEGPKSAAAIIKVGLLLQNLISKDEISHPYNTKSLVHIVPPDRPLLLGNLLPLLSCQVDCSRIVDEDGLSIFFISQPLDPQDFACALVKSLFFFCLLEYIYIYIDFVVKKNLKLTFFSTILSFS